MPERILVIDIGKTNAKVAVVDAGSLAQIDFIARPSRVLPGPPYPHADTDGIWAFLLDALGALHARHGADAVSITAHGATAALLDADGRLALPVLDYEHPGPDALADAYDAARPAFAETGTPKLPGGLVVGRQLFWQFATFPAAARATRILMYPQYWAHRLTGVAASEATSLGCHTDLWNPAARDFSSLVAAQGWRPLFPALRAASDCLGPITRQVADATGLSPATPVFCGIHDSNASLLPHLRSRRAPFAVVSTGTWVVTMAVGGRAVQLDPGRDTLVNVNAFGDPVPSARFMGGREWELTRPEPLPDPAAVGALLERGIFLLPSVVAGSGPFPDRRAQWIGPADATPAERTAALSLYLAMMTSTCLELIGAAGPTLVEGPFARNALYVAMLGAATGRPVVLPAPGSTGTSLGAALLALPEPPAPQETAAATPEPDPALATYADRWRARAARPVDA
ncbi:MAG: FGGY-family carbohydrate kinase [Amaricoccus sp.]|uniref:FGGY-family carbohydrate kinase n=1 Tax=Amaricoccus sp. TaxID=1872485 RepID=UPI0039E306AC